MPWARARGGGGGGGGGGQQDTRRRAEQELREVGWTRTAQHASTVHAGLVNRKGKLGLARAQAASPGQGQGRASTAQTATHNGAETRTCQRPTQGVTAPRQKGQLCLTPPCTHRAERSGGEASRKPTAVWKSPKATYSSTRFSCSNRTTDGAGRALISQRERVAVACSTQGHILEHALLLRAPSPSSADRWADRRDSSKQGQLAW